MRTQMVIQPMVVYQCWDSHFGIPKISKCPDRTSSWSMAYGPKMVKVTFLGIMIGWKQIMTHRIHVWYIC